MKTAKLSNLQTTNRPKGDQFITSLNVVQTQGYINSPQKITRNALSNKKVTGISNLTVNAPPPVVMQSDIVNAVQTALNGKGVPI
jgi:hypothetical protein